MLENLKESQNNSDSFRGEWHPGIPALMSHGVALLSLKDICTASVTEALEKMMHYDTQSAKKNTARNWAKNDAEYVYFLI